MASTRIWLLTNAILSHLIPTASQIMATRQLRKTNLLARRLTTHGDEDLGERLRSTSADGLWDLEMTIMNGQKLSGMMILNGQMLNDVSTR